MKTYTNAPFLVKLGANGYDLDRNAGDWKPGEELPVDLVELELLSDPAPSEDENPPSMFGTRPPALRFRQPPRESTPALRHLQYSRSQVPNRECLDEGHRKPLHPRSCRRANQRPAASVQAVAREFATTKPAAIIQNIGAAQRTDHGVLAVISHAYLVAMTGNVGVLGGRLNDTGGVIQYVKISNPVDLQENPAIDPVSITQLGKYIMADKPHPIRYLHIAWAGVLTKVPDTNTMIEAFKKVDFVVVQDQFLNTTARYADIALPACTIFEAKNVTPGIRSRCIQLMEPAIEPLFASRSDQWILGELAKRVA